jgi:hypothetical protein
VVATLETNDILDSHAPRRAIESVAELTLTKRLANDRHVDPQDLSLICRSGKPPVQALALPNYFATLHPVCRA